MASYFAPGIFLMYHASQIFVIHESHEDDDGRMFCFTFPASQLGYDHTSRVFIFAFWLLITSSIVKNSHS